VLASLGGPRKSIGTDHSHTDRILGPYTVSEIIRNFVLMT